MGMIKNDKMEIIGLNGSGQATTLWNAWEKEHE